MKRLLNLLGIITFTVLTTTQVVSCVSKQTKNDNTDGNTTVAKHKILTNSNIIDSSSIAKALIMKDSDNYSIQSTLQVEYNRNLNNEEDVKNIFGMYSSSIQGAVESNSQIKYENDDNKTKTLDNYFPEIDINGSKLTIDEILNLSKSLIDSQGSANGLINMIFSGQLINFSEIIGKTLSDLLGQNNLLLNVILKPIINNPDIILGSINDVINNISKNFNGKQYATFTKGKLDETSAFGLANKNLEPTVSKIVQNKEPLNKNDVENILNYLLILMSYVSQFNFDSTTSVGENLFDSKIKNTDYIENLNNKLVPTSALNSFINLNNIADLIDSISTKTTNNGLGFAQLIYVLFGNSNSITENDNKTDIASGKIIPTENCKNPISSSLGDLINIALSSSLNNNSNDLLNFLGNANIGEQLIGAVGSLFSNIVENKKIDTSLNYFEELSTLGSIINKLPIMINPNSKPLINNDVFESLSKLLTDIKSFKDITSIDNTFVPTNLNSTNDSYNVIYPILNSEESQTDMYKNIWTGKNIKTPIVNDIVDFISKIDSSFLNKEITTTNTTFTGLGSYVNNLLNDEILNTKISTIMSDLSSGLRFISNNIFNSLPTIINDLDNVLEPLYGTLTDDKNITNAQNVYKTVVTTEGQQNADVQSILNTDNKSVLTYISAITVAYHENNNGKLIQSKYSSNMNNILLNILRGENQDAPITEVNPDSFIGVLNNVYAKIKEVLDSNLFDQLLNGMKKLESYDFINTLNGFTLENIVKKENNDIKFIPYEYSYQLEYIDPKTGEKTDYQIILTEQSATTKINSLHYELSLNKIIN